MKITLELGPFTQLKVANPDVTFTHCYLLQLSWFRRCAISYAGTTRTNLIQD